MGPLLSHILSLEDLHWQALYVEYFFCNYFHCFLSHFFQVFLQISLLQWNFPHQPTLNYGPLSHSLAYFFPNALTTIWHTMYFLCLLIVCLPPLVCKRGPSLTSLHWGFQLLFMFSHVRVCACVLVFYTRGEGPWDSSSFCKPSNAIKYLIQDLFLISLFFC